MYVPFATDWQHKMARKLISELVKDIAFGILPLVSEYRRRASVEERLFMFFVVRLA